MDFTISMDPKIGGFPVKALRKKIYIAAGYNTVYFGSGRKEFDPNKPMPGFETCTGDAWSNASYGIW